MWTSASFTSAAPAEKSISSLPSDFLLFFYRTVLCLPISALPRISSLACTSAGLEQFCQRQSKQRSRRQSEILLTAQACPSMTARHLSQSLPEASSPVWILLQYRFHENIGYCSDNLFEMYPGISCFLSLQEQRDLLIPSPPPNKIQAELFQKG